MEIPVLGFPEVKKMFVTKWSYVDSAGEKNYLITTNIYQLGQYEKDF